MTDQTTTAPDTLPHWLYVRFGKGGIAWHELDPADRSYWEHQARAVRRAVDRGGFKNPEPEARACHLVHDHDGHEPHTWTDVDGNWLNCPGNGDSADERTAQERADDIDQAEQYQLYREATRA